MPIDLFACLRVLPTDYDAYGGEVKRWSDPDVDYPDCSRGCKFFVPLADELRYDWGVCSKSGAPRAGLLTWEHQAGFGCFESDEQSDGTQQLQRSHKPSISRTSVSLVFTSHRGREEKRQSENDE